MPKFGKNTVYFSSYAKLPGEMPSAYFNRNLDIGLIINYETHTIEGMSCTLITEDTKEFLKSIFIGSRMDESGVQQLINEINHRYFGASQKAICVIVKMLYEKYNAWIAERPIPSR
ncbi:MAG: DUF3870 domain-containing protein [Acidaminobacter sp.]|uniref:DUF3870 domain-containing protein n=1 Tax=Acidaminobacter sp. TaxID=1872102 RepID=UPI00137D5A79|nr:DUF3870 domain-containing protein [Acidaminobacter sp.]MZQ98224.1 DUF3870 domain-containing protein [Acidaminobacter sp.]